MAGDKLCEPASASSASKWATTAEAVHAWRNGEKAGGITPSLSVSVMWSVVLLGAGPLSGWSRLAITNKAAEASVDVGDLQVKNLMCHRPK
jgi:hypothetical protein